MMTIKRTVMALLLSVTMNAGFCQTIKLKEYRVAIDSASKLVTNLQSKLLIPGLSICVSNSNEVLWSQAFGLADLENGTPLTTESKFRVGSISKCLTSLAIGKLYQEGKLALDSPIQHYVPQFPKKKFSFTIRQLAGHTSGIRHYREDDPAYPIRYKSVTEGLQIFEKDSLLFEPGTGYAYSTYAYTLISAAIENASHMPFVTYMKNEVFTPLNMHNTVPDYSDSIVPNRVRFYDDYGNGLVNAVLVDNSYKWAGGGYLSTPTDLTAMGRELLTPSLLKPDIVRTLLTPQRLKNGTPTIAGIAWRVEADTKGRPIIHHGGTIEGGRAFIAIFPDQNIVIAICANKNVGGGIDKKEMEKIADYFSLSRPRKEATR
jgi:CubicO group peptidase (beta-lactamase class C family)